jgi:hypothetical protein
MRLRKQNIRKWIIKILAILVVLFMVFAGFVVMFWK